MPVPTPTPPGLPVLGGPETPFHLRPRRVQAVLHQLERGQYTTASEAGQVGWDSMSRREGGPVLMGSAARERSYRVLFGRHPIAVPSQQLVGDDAIKRDAHLFQGGPKALL